MSLVDQIEKDRHVIVGIIPCVAVTSLKTDASAAFDAYFDMLMVRSNLASRIEGTQGTVAILRWARALSKLLAGKVNDYLGFSSVSSAATGCTCTVS